MVSLQLHGFCLEVSLKVCQTVLNETCAAPGACWMRGSIGGGLPAGHGARVEASLRTCCSIHQQHGTPHQCANIFLESPRVTAVCVGWRTPCNCSSVALSYFMARQWGSAGILRNTRCASEKLISIQGKKASCAQASCRLAGWAPAGHLTHRRARVLTQPIKQRQMPPSGQVNVACVHHHCKWWKLPGLNKQNAF